MNILDFPPSPVNGQVFPPTPIVGINQYQWDSAAAVWRLLGPVVLVTPGVYGGPSAIPVLTVDGQGRITAAQNTTFTGSTVVAAPATQTSPGAVGQVAITSSYFYWYDGSQWQRVAASGPW